MADFLRAVAVVLPEEGIHAADPNDPGGDTWYGIARRYHPDEPWPPTRDRAIELYRTEYWPVVRGDDIPDQGVADMLLDAAVNQGAKTAVMILQRALNALEPKATAFAADGIFGPLTMGRLRAERPDALVDEILAQRAMAYVTAKDFPRFERTWFRRLAQVHRAAVTAG